MALLKQDNPIVTTYPMYYVSMDYEMKNIYAWLKQYSKYVGVGATYRGAPVFGLCYRVFAKLSSESELLFVLKFGAQRQLRPKKTSVKPLLEFDNE